MCLPSIMLKSHLPTNRHETVATSVASFMRIGQILHTASMGPAERLLRRILRVVCRYSSRTCNTSVLGGNDERESMYNSQLRDKSRPRVSTMANEKAKKKATN